MDIIDNREVYCEQWTDYEESKRDRSTILILSAHELIRFNLTRPRLSE